MELEAEQTIRKIKYLESETAIKYMEEVVAVNNCRQVRRIAFERPREALPKKTPTSVGWVFSLVGPTRENWNYIFSDLRLLCERLEELDIEAIMEADK